MKIASALPYLIIFRPSPNSVFIYNILFKRLGGIRYMCWKYCIFDLVLLFIMSMWEVSLLIFPLILDIYHNMCISCIQSLFNVSNCIKCCIENLKTPCWLDNNAPRLTFVIEKYCWGIFKITHLCLFVYKIFYCENRLNATQSL